jgi:hypothetical protein
MPLEQEYSLASMRILHPTLYPVELLITAHKKLSQASEQVQLPSLRTQSVHSVHVVTCDKNRLMISPHIEKKS